MTQPNPDYIIERNGRTLYLNPYSGQYTPSRSYGLRMQRNYSRGLSQSEARGHRGIEIEEGSGEYLTESMRRRRGRERTDHPDETELGYAIRFRQRYGFSYFKWRQLRRESVDAINAMIKSPQNRITPDWITDELLNVTVTGHDFEWVRARSAEKLYAMRMYRRLGKRGGSGAGSPGFIQFQQRDIVTRIEWWYYR